MMPAGDMPYTPPRCPLGVVVFAFQRHRMNRRDRRPNPRFLTTATQGEVPSVDVRLVWELRVLRGAHARACYELGQKPHRNADSTLGLGPSRFPFFPFLSRF